MTTKNWLQYELKPLQSLKSVQKLDTIQLQNLWKA
jgi:hypothetical protein